MTPLDAAKKQELEVVMVRIRKLLALGTSPNEHEAALAVSKAQELLQKYDLSMESIENLSSDSRTSIRKGGNVVKSTEGKPEGWKNDLFEVVAETHDCFTAYTHEYENVKTKKGYRAIKHGKMIGFGHDVEMAHYELDFLVAEVSRLAQDYANKMWQQIRHIEQYEGITHQEAEARFVKDTGRHPLKAKLYFIKGATETVVDNLRKAYRQRQDAAQYANPNALVLRKRESVRDHIYMEQYGLTYDQYMTKIKLENEEYYRKHPVGKVDSVEITPEQAEKLAAKAKRREEMWSRRFNKEWQNMDHTALKEGRQAGHEVTTKPGLNGGANHKEID